MRIGGVAAGVVTAICFASANAASATVIVPTTTVDDLSNNGNCTLREAIQAANTDAASRVRATRRRSARCAVRPRAKGRWLWIG